MPQAPTARVQWTETHNQALASQPLIIKDHELIPKIVVLSRSNHM